MKNKKESKEESLEELAESDEEDSEEEIFSNEEFAFNDSFIEIESSLTLERITTAQDSRLNENIFIHEKNQMEDSFEEGAFRYDSIKKEEDKKYDSYGADFSESLEANFENEEEFTFKNSGRPVSRLESGSSSKENFLYQKNYEIENMDIGSLGKEKFFESHLKKYDSKPK